MRSRNHDLPASLPNPVFVENLLSNSSSSLCPILCLVGHRYSLNFAWTKWCQKDIFGAAIELYLILSIGPWMPRKVFGCVSIYSRRRIGRTKLLNPKSLWVERRNKIIFLITGDTHYGILIMCQELCKIPYTHHVILRALVLWARSPRLRIRSLFEVTDLQCPNQSVLGSVFLSFLLFPWPAPPPPPPLKLFSFGDWAIPSAEARHSPVALLSTTG